MKIKRAALIGGILGIIAAGILTFTKNPPQPELKEYELHATVLENRSEHNSLLVEKANDSRTTYSVYFSDENEETVLDTEGNRISMGDLAPGTKIKVVYDGFIYTKSPGIIRGTIRIEVVNE